jgi:cytochrome P450
MHNDTHIWGSDAKSFNPARWLGADAKQLETHICTFSKGARQCIGMKYVAPKRVKISNANSSSVAYAEITITLAHLFHQFKMELKTKQLCTVDRFTQQVLEPGVLVDFKLRQKS